DYFMGTGSLQEAAKALASLLSQDNIDYAIAGALACAAYGYERMTTDIDVLITPEDLQRFKRSWLGRGYVEVVPGLKAVRDTQRNIKVDFLLTGDFPGDGKPKPVAVPHPVKAAEDIGSYRVVTLPLLLELKIASGMSAPHRMRDLDDAMRLIRVNHLEKAYADKLDPFVRAKFLELWNY